MKSERKIGIAQILLSGICFGFLGLFGKMAYERGLEPGELLSLRFLIGGSICFAILLLTQPRTLQLKQRELVTCSALGVFGYAVFSSCFFQALKGLSASLTVLLLYMYPVMVAAGAWILFGEKIAKSRWVALPLVMAGLLFLIWGDLQILNPWALAFGIASAVFYSIYILASSHWLKGINPLASVTYIQLSAGIALSAIHWRDYERFLSMVSDNWLLLLAVALICSVAAMGLFLAGLKKLKNWEVSVLSTAEPVTNILLAIVFLKEQFTLTQSLGAFAILAAFLLVAA